MKIIYCSIAAVILNLFVASSAFAVGSGSGGSPPPCTESTWTCTDWSSCSTSGSQTRNCALSFSCPTASTPQPQTTQSCTPPASAPVAPVVTTSPVSQPQSSDTQQTTTNSQVTAPAPPEPACTESKWQCGAWSQSCDIYGQEHRSCSLVADCPVSPTPSPANSRACTHLQCGNKATLHDRVSCRLNLAPEGAAQEFKIQYLPEECRTAPNAKEKSECIARYKSFAPCWNLPAGETRFECARKVLNLEQSVIDEAKQCQGKTGADQTLCEAALKEKVLYSIKFRFYDLEQRAEDLARRGADLSTVADLETVIETKKQEFDDAKTKDQLTQIILDVRSAWQSFVSQVKDAVK
jgi:hypothetical protein